MASVRENTEKLEPLYVAPESVKWCNHFVKLVWLLNTELSDDPVIQLLSISLKDMKTYVYTKKDCNTNTHSIIQNNQKVETTQMTINDH